MCMDGRGKGDLCGDPLHAHVLCTGVLCASVQYSVRPVQRPSSTESVQYSVRPIQRPSSTASVQYIVVELIHYLVCSSQFPPVTHD